MSTYTSVRAMVRTDVADAARDKAETEGQTLSEAVASLLEVYVSKPRSTKARKRSTTA